LRTLSSKIALALFLLAPAALPCASGGTCQYNLKDAAASGSNFGSLQDGGSIGAAATNTGYDATVSTGKSDECYNTTNSVGTDPLNATPQNAVTCNGSANHGNGWRSENPISGSFANTNWSWAIREVKAFTGSTLSVCVTLFKASSPTGASATAIGSESCSTGSTVTFTASGTVAPGGIVTFSGEYLFAKVAWNLTVIGSTATWTVNVDSTISNIITPVFTVPSGVFTLPLTGVGQ
jgi:hypothetical protein